MERKNNFSYFANKDCVYFPCHENANPESFNCLFCYCPLYALGDKCGGNFRYMDNGIKDCSKCMLPHSEAGYSHVVMSFEKLVEMMRRQREAEQGEK